MIPITLASSRTPLAGLKRDCSQRWGRKVNATAARRALYYIGDEKGYFTYSSAQYVNSLDSAKQTHTAHTLE